MYKNIFILIGALLISSCTTHTSHVAKDNIEAAHSKSQDEREAHTKLSKNNTQQSFSDGISIVGLPYKIHSLPTYPDTFDKRFPFDQKSEKPFSKTISDISHDSQFKIIMRPDAEEYLTKKSQTNKENAEQKTDSSGSLAKLSRTSRTEPNLSIVDFSGSFKSLLDHVTSRVGLFWEWRDDHVEIYRNEVKTFILDSQGRSSSGVATVSTNTSASAGDGAGASIKSGIQSVSTMDYNLWGDLEAMLNGMKSEFGHIVMSKASGTITVHDTPPVVNRIESTIKDINKVVGKLVLLKVEIFQIETSGDSNFGIDWNLVFNDGVSSSVLNTLNQFTGGFAELASTNIDQSSKFNTSSVLVKALEKQGKVSRVNQLHANVMNGDQIDLQDVFEQSYLASSKTSVTQETITSELIPGSAISGLTINVRPVISSNGSVLLFSSFNMTVLRSLETLTSSTGDTQLQLPNRAVRTVVNTSRTKSGSPILITGFQQMNSDASNEGLGSSQAWMMGGNKKDSYGSTELVILITPFVMG